MKNKSFYKMLLFCMLCFLLVACSPKDNTTIKAEEETGKQTSELTKKEESKEEKILDLDKLLQDTSKIEISVLETMYTVQDDQYKSLYPDILQVIIQNNTDRDIKDAVVALVAWDVNNLPVKLKGSIDFSDGSYIKEVAYNDINLIGGGTYGEKGGFEIDETIDVDKFKAIVISYEDFDGEKWDNPYYKNFREQYEGKRYIE